MRPLPVTVCCVVLISVFVGCRSSHDQESFYAVLSDAKKDGAIDRGWLPDFLPKSSHSIHEVHDLSPSEVWCAFEFEPADAEKLVKNLKSGDALLPAIGRIPSPRVQWWPRFLEGNLDVQKIQAEGFALYSASIPVSQVENETLLFAIDRTKGRGYFYGH